jgi:hypothetical protein
MKKLQVQNNRRLVSSFRNAQKAAVVFAHGGGMTAVIMRCCEHGSGAKRAGIVLSSR